jgi:hypothetical protein
VGRNDETGDEEMRRGDEGIVSRPFARSSPCMWCGASASAQALESCSSGTHQRFFGGGSSTSASMISCTPEYRSMSSGRTHALQPSRHQVTPRRMKKSGIGRYDVMNVATEGKTSMTVPVRHGPRSLTVPVAREEDVEAAEEHDEACPDDDVPA